MSLKTTDVRTPGAAEIAKKWNLPLRKVYGLISQGAKVEFEHNRDKEKAKQVARDHINERPDYYKRLKSMERLPIRMKEGLSTEPERDTAPIGDYTGTSRKVMKVDEVKIPPKVKKAVAVGMTAANIATGAQVYDHASRGVGSPIKDVAAVATGVPGKVGWSITPGHYALKGLQKTREYIKSKHQAKKMEEQGSPANPARYTERPMYEEDTMKNAEDKIKAAFTADKVKGMFKRVDKQRDKDPKWVAYKKRKQQSIKEQLMTAKQNAAQSQGSMANLSPIKGGSISSSAERDRSFKDVVTRPPTGTTIASKPAIVPKYSNLSGVTPRVDTHTISKMVQGGRTPPVGTPKLNISVDKTTGSTGISRGGDEASKYAADAMRHLDLNRDRAAGFKPIATEPAPIKGTSDARVDMEARRQAGIRGTTDPDTEKAIQTMRYGNRDINPVTPSDKPGAITADAENQSSSKAAPTTPSSTMGQSPEVKSINDVIQGRKTNEELMTAKLGGRVPMDDPHTVTPSDPPGPRTPSDPPGPRTPSDKPGPVTPSDIQRNISEMETRPLPTSRNIDDRRPGFNFQGLKQLTVDKFNKNMADRQAGDHYEFQKSKYVPNTSVKNYSDPQKPMDAAIGAVKDTVKQAGSYIKDRLGVDGKPFPSSYSAANRFSHPSYMPLQKVAQTPSQSMAASLPSGGGATPSTLGSANTPNKNDSKPFDWDDKTGEIDAAIKQYNVSKNPGPTVSAAGEGSSGGGGRSITSNPTGWNVSQGAEYTRTPKTTGDEEPSNAKPTSNISPKRNELNEISAELVGKVSNARFWRKEAPSKTLTRAINKKFIESGKKKEEPKKPVKEEETKKDVRLMGNQKPDAYGYGAKGTIKTIHEETTMDTKDLINEALDDIIENNLVSMKENLMTALQEKAMEKLEEKKKEIASNYFAQ